MDAGLIPVQGQGFDILDQLDAPVDRELTDIEQLRHPTNRRLFSWWSALAGAQGGPPARRSFDIADFLRDSTNMFFAAREDTGHWYYRIRGEAFLDLFGPERLETCVDKYHYRVFEHPVSRYMTQVAEQRVCRFTTGVFHSRRLGPQDFESVDCPLVDEHGNVAYIIGAAVVFRRAGI